jgi:hypothetical protein
MIFNALLPKAPRSLYTQHCEPDFLPEREHNCSTVERNAIKEFKSWKDGKKRKSMAVI